MDPDVRTALLWVGLIFCLGFAAMTIAVIAQSGLDLLTVVSLLIIVLVGFGLYGAVRSPPE